MKAPDRVILEALEQLKAKAERKAQYNPYRHHPDPLLCPCKECKANYVPMRIDSRHFAIDSTFNRGRD